MVIKLSNAFSLNMLKESGAYISVRQIPPEEAKRLLEGGFVSFIGHDDTARLLSALLGLPISTNRQSLVLEDGETLLVAQYRGPRLPEGATTLPPGARVDWFLVSVWYSAPTPSPSP